MQVDNETNGFNLNNNNNLKLKNMKSKLIEKNGKHYRKSQVVILPSENQSLLFKKGSGLIEYNPFPPLHGVKSLGWEYQNLYFLSDEEIKEGDWFIEFNLNKKRNSYCNKPYLCDIGNTGGFILTKNNGNFPFPENCKKIIATTDSFIKINNPNYDVGELAYINIPKPSTEFIDAYVESYNNGKIIEKVLVEYVQEDGFGNTENFKTFSRYYYLKLKKDNTIITKKFEERLFSELEVVGFLRKYKKHFNLEIDSEKELSFIESNLK